MAYDRSLDQEVALAIVSKEGLDDHAIARIENEARFMGRARKHENIVTLYDFVHDSQGFYLISELMEGGDLESLIQSMPLHQVPLDVLIGIASDISRALSHIHENRIIHRDVKPGNIWLAADGKAKLGDFGLAMESGVQAQAPDAIVGSVSYMSPEQIRGRSDEIKESADLYALGATMYEMATGRPPFEGKTSGEIMSKHINDAPNSPVTLRTDLPRSLELMIVELLAKEPSDRPGSAADIQERLQEFFDLDLPGQELPQTHETCITDPSDRVFVGRTAVIGEITGILDEVKAGNGRVVLVIGNPGIGKTSTVEQLTEYARASDLNVVWGYCAEQWSSQPYYPWMQVVRKLRADAYDSESQEGLGSLTKSIGHVDPLRDFVFNRSASSAQTDREAQYQLFEETSDFLVSACSPDGLVVALDDIHWADADSLSFIAFLSKRLQNSPLLLVCTFQDWILGRNGQFSKTIAELTRDARTKRIYLRGLEEGEVYELFRRMTGAVLDSNEIRSIFQETDGNPFYLTELIRLRARSTSDQGPAPVFFPVFNVIEQRLKSLSMECNEMLSVASVIGRNFDLARLHRVTETPNELLLEVLEEAVRAQVLVTAGSTNSFRFTEELVRKTVYVDMPLAKRLRLHLRVGEILEGQLPSDSSELLAELAFHFQISAPIGGANKAVQYLMRAGHRAVEQFAWEQAVDNFAAAVTALEQCEPLDEHLRLELLLNLADAEMRAGEGQRATMRLKQSLRLAESLGATEQLAEAALYLGGGGGVDEIDEELNSLLESVLESIPPAASVLRLRVLVKIAVSLYYVPGSLTRREELTAEAVELAQRLGDEKAVALALGSRSRALWGPDNLDERLTDLAENERLAESAEGGFAGFWNRGWRSRRIHSLLEIGDIELVGREIDAFNAVVAGSNQLFDRWLQLQFQTMRQLILGNFADAERLANEARPIGQRTSPTHGPDQHFARHIVAIRREQGRLAEVEEIVRQLSESNPKIPHWQCLLAWLLVQDGRAEEAMPINERFAKTEFRTLPRDAYWISNLALISEGLVIGGGAANLDLLYDQLTPYRTRNVTPAAGAICYGSVSYFLGLLASKLGRWEAARSHFEEAISMNAALGARPFVARTRFALAQMYVERAEQNDKSLALEQIVEAIDSCTGLAMPMLTQSLFELRERLRAAVRG